MFVVVILIAKAQVIFSNHNQHQNCLKLYFSTIPPGFAPDPAGGAYNASPDPLVNWGGGYSLPIPHPLDSLGVSTLGASNSTPSASLVRR